MQLYRVVPITKREGIGSLAIVHITRNWWMTVSCGFEPHQQLPLLHFKHKTLPSLLSTGWFLEQIQVLST